MKHLIRTLPLLGLAASMSLTGCAAEDDYLGPPDAEELSDLGILAVPAYAMSLTSTIYLCEHDQGGRCIPGIEEDSATVTMTAAVDVSGEPIVLPCTGSGKSSKEFEIDSDSLQRVPSGAARAGLLDGSLDMQLAILMGVNLDDPFGEDLPTDKNDRRVVDHDGDGKEGMTYKHWTGKIRFGARLVIETLGIDPTLERPSVTASLSKVDYAIFSDSIPFVNVAKKVDEYMANHRLAHDETTATFVIIEEATCRAVGRVL